MTFLKFCELCDFFITTFGVDEEQAERLATKVWDIVGCEATDANEVLALKALMDEALFEEI